MGEMMGSKPAQSMQNDRVGQLMELITTTVTPDTWQLSGGYGRIAAFNGLIVINHDPHAHRMVERVLGMLRDANGDRAGAIVRDE